MVCGKHRCHGRRTRKGEREPWPQMILHEGANHALNINLSFCLLQNLSSQVNKCPQSENLFVLQKQQVS